MEIPHVEFLNVDDTAFQSVKEHLAEHNFKISGGNEGDVRGREIIGRFAYDAQNKRLHLEIVALPSSLTPGFVSGWLHDYLASHAAIQARGAA